MILQATGGGSAGSGSGNSGGSGQGVLAGRVITASALPEAVDFNRIVVITDIQPTNIFFGYDEPFDAQTGDVWIHTLDGGQYDFFVGGITLTPGLTVQYDGTSWVYRDAYIGRFRKWALFSTALTSLEALSWSQVLSIANSGEDCSKFFNVGDTKNITLTTGETITMAIGGFNLNTITGTEKTASIAWTMPDCLAATYAVHSTASNAVSWGGCVLRTTTLTAIFELLPEEIKRAVKYVDVVTSIGGGGKELVTTSDRLRLHSVTELGLTATYAAVEGAVYPYYAEGNRSKTVSGVAAKYWTRTPATNGDASFYNILTSGSAGAANANIATNGISFCFDT